MKIDAHQHFWLYNEDDYGWMADMPPLKQDRLPSDLKPLIDDAGINGTVAVQARQCLAETEWLLSLADENPLIKGVVGWVDLRSDDARAQLEQYAQHPKLVGARHVVHDEPDDAFMAGDAFGRGLALLPEFNLTFDLLLFPKHLSLACEIVRRFPNLKFVLDHISKPLIKDGVMEPWRSDIQRLAAFDNVACKVSGMVTEADWDNWTPADLRPYIDVVFEAFGPERIMLGSDWPVCTVAGDYGKVMQVGADYIASLSADEQDSVWGGAAQRFYGVE